MKPFLLLFILALTGCSNSKTNEKPIVAVSIVPQEYFVKSIADSLVDIMILVEPGSSPELYELRPVQMAKLAKTVAWLGIGKIEFEQGWKKKILESNPSLLFFDTSSQADWIAQEIQDHGDHKHLHGVDPHIWSSPKEGLKIATETYKALCRILPEHKELLTENYNRLLKKITTLDQQLDTIFSNSRHKSFLIFHPSLSYLARDYQLKQIPIEIEGKESSPKYLQQFVKQAQELQLNEVLIQKEFNKNTAKQICKEINGKLVEINPLGEDWYQELLNIAHIITQNK